MSYQILTLAETLAKINGILTEIPEEKKELVTRNLVDISISHNAAIRQIKELKKTIDTMGEHIKNIHQIDL